MVSESGDRGVDSGVRGFDSGGRGFNSGVGVVDSGVGVVDSSIACSIQATEGSIQATHGISLWLCQNMWRSMQVGAHHLSQQVYWTLDVQPAVLRCSLCISVKMPVLETYRLTTQRECGEVVGSAGVVGNFGSTDQ
ncbi:hypothetical protein Acr_22g0010000 [Actinidia rufa]|uniref:Uncharacterized protein n=1 Tax=Actinidia rufa TaxID=165716 RepID=A0A7J0GLG0_9ERIC|nr:hypothetical protein Acr_22g0010000 [Actinidia rufa]